MTRVSPPAPTGLILAGGQSRRMRDAFADGHGHKALLPVGGRPMLGLVIEALRPQAGALVLSANDDAKLFAAFGLPVVADPIEGFAGPLAGVLAGLRWSAAHAPGATHVASVSADAPFLPPDLVERLSGALAGGSGSIALARSGGTVHPVIGLWPVALADDLEAWLQSGARKVLTWAEEHGAVAVDFPARLVKGRMIDPFFNANTPADLAEARALLDA